MSFIFLDPIQHYQDGYERTIKAHQYRGQEGGKYG